MPWPTGSQALTRVSDAELTVQVRRGRTDGFRLLYRRHYPAVQGYALTCTRTPLDAFELTRHAFTSLLHKLVSGEAVTGRLAGCLRLQLFDLVRTLAVQRCVRDAEGFSQYFRHWVDSGANWSLNDGGPLVQAWQHASAEIRCLLWHAVVDRDSPAHLARETGIRPDELRKAQTGALAAVRYACAAPYLAQMNLEEDCRTAIEALLTVQDDPTAVHHCYVCQKCFAMHQDLVHIDQRLEAQLPTALLGWWPVFEYLNFKATIPMPVSDPPFIDRAVRQARKATDRPTTTAQEVVEALRSRPVASIVTFTSGAAFGSLAGLALFPLGNR